MISLLQHPFLQQTNLFKQSYLFNNFGHHVKMLHAFKLSSYTTFRMEAGKEKEDLDFKEQQQINYFIGTNNILNEKRNSKLNLSSENRYIKFKFDHDRFKNNRGEYKLYFVHQALKQQLQDSIERGIKLFNYSWDDQRRKLMMFHGGEKYLIGKRYLLEIGFQTGFNNVYRMMQYNDIKKNELEIFQKYLSTDIGLSFQKVKHSFHAGHRFVKEQRELSTEFWKQYVFVEYQFRLNKKLLFNTDISVGKGELSSKSKKTTKTIYQLEGEMIYTKSIFNQTYLKYFISQRLPTIEAWMVDPLLQLSGYTQYQYLPDRFSLIRNLEWGKSYQHLFRGFGFNYSVIASHVKNDAFHSIEFHSLNIVDTIRYGNHSSNIQFRAAVDQFIFPVKIRVSTSFQFTSASMYQGIMGQSYSTLLNLQSIRLACKSSWEKSFQWEYAGSFQRNQTKIGGKGTNIYFFIHQLNAKYKLSKKLYTAVQTSYIEYQGQKKYIFLDLLFQLRSSERFSLNLSILNTTNVDRFKHTYVLGYGVQSVSTPLAGRKLQIEFRKSF